MVGPAEVTSKPGVEAVGEDLARGARRLEREQQAGAADRQRFGELGAALPDVLEQLLVDSLDDGARSRADDRVAAERRRVVAGLEADRSVVGCEQRADRQAVREPFRQRDEVWADAELLEGEEGAGAADPGLNLVEAEQRAVLGGELRRGAEETGSRGQHAALALDRLEQDQPGVRADRRLERGDVVQLRET